MTTGGMRKQFEKIRDAQLKEWSAHIDLLPVYPKRAGSDEAKEASETSRVSPTKRGGTKVRSGEWWVLGEGAWKSLKIRVVKIWTHAKAACGVAVSRFN